jgi:hypothetical protein
VSDLHLHLNVSQRPFTAMKILSGRLLRFGVCRIAPIGVMRFLGRRPTERRTPQRKTNDGKLLCFCLSDRYVLKIDCQGIHPSGDVEQALTSGPPSISINNTPSVPTLSPPSANSPLYGEPIPRSSFDTTTSPYIGIVDQPQPRLSPPEAPLGARMSLLSLNIFSSGWSSKSLNRRAVPVGAKSSHDIIAGHLDVPSHTSGLRRRLCKRPMNLKEDSRRFSQTALAVKNILSGSFLDASRSPSPGPRAASKARIIAVQKALLDSGAANDVIANFGHISPHTTNPSPSPTPAEKEVYEGPSFPVHGVCLEFTDEVLIRKYFRH